MHWDILFWWCASVAKQPTSNILRVFGVFEKSALGTTSVGSTNGTNGTLKRQTGLSRLFLFWLVKGFYGVIIENPFLLYGPAPSHKNLKFNP
jgi:hypothetical protein